MQLGHIDFPASLIRSIEDDRLVVFAGAGVSMGPPTCLPSFQRLAEGIAAGTGRDPTNPLDGFLGALQGRGVAVHECAARMLSENSQPNELHRAILTIFEPARRLRLVTTNFDLAFEAALEKQECAPPIFTAPAMPLGDDFAGLVHIHGDVREPRHMVLTDADFGRAYLTRGWARRFLVDLFTSFDVLFIGYSHTDLVMSYLARALPPAMAKRRYALDAESADADKWANLGIEAIPFPQAHSTDYSSLYGGLNRLAALCAKTILDWEKELKQLATSPPQEIEAEHRLVHALGAEATARLFLTAAKSEAWMPWLEQKGFLAPVFRTGNPTTIEQLFIDWFVNRALDAPAAAMAACGRNELRFGATCWWQLARHVSNSPELSNANFTLWARILLGSAPARPGSYAFHWLAESAAKRGLRELAADVFICMLAPALRLRSALDGDYGPRIALEDGVLSEHWDVSEILKHLKTDLRGMDEYLFLRLMRLLQERHIHVREQFGDAAFDMDSYGRSAIEPDEQDRYPEPVDVLIDAARDCIESITANRSEDAAFYRQLMVRSSVPLLQRLALHSMSLDRVKCADEKVAWMLSLDIHAPALRHEAFVLLRSEYPQCSEPMRRAVLAKINEYVAPEDDRKDYLTALRRFVWFAWIGESAPSCPNVAAEIQKIKDKHPDLVQREHPDKTHWTGEARWLGNESPFTVDQLLSAQAAEWVVRLQEFKGEQWEGPSRRGMLLAVTLAAKQSPAWGLSVIDSLLASGEAACDLTGAVLDAWSSWPSEYKDAVAVVDMLEKIPLSALPSREVAQTLHGLIKEKNDYSTRLIPRLMKFADRLTAKLIAETGDEVGVDDWLTKSINRPSGVLAEFWLGCLSAQDQAQPMPAVIKSTFEYALRAQEGGYFRCVLCSQLAFLMHRDEVWTSVNLVPAFSSERTVNFRQAWDGFLAWGRLTPRVVAALEAPFLAAVARLDEFSEDHRRQFIRLYVSALAFGDFPSKADWLPKLFRELTTKDKMTVAYFLEEMVRSNGAEVRQKLWTGWLKRYWTDRLSGIPAPFSTEEVEPMLGCACHLPEFFSDAVSLAVRMPRAKIEHSSIIHELSTNELPNKYPNETAKLLGVLLDAEAPVYVFYGVEKVISALSKSALENHVRNSLIEALVRRGLNSDELRAMH